jgi:hypothetical protein
MGNELEVDLSFCDGCELRDTLADGRYCARKSLDISGWFYSGLDGPIPVFREDGASYEATPEQAHAETSRAMLPDIVRCIRHVQEHGVRPPGPTFLH